MTGSGVPKGRGAWGAREMVFPFHRQSDTTASYMGVNFNDPSLSPIPLGYKLFFRIRLFHNCPCPYLNQPGVFSIYPSHPLALLHCWQIQVFVIFGGPSRLPEPVVLYLRKKSYGMEELLPPQFSNIFPLMCKKKIIIIHSVYVISYYT